MKIHAYLTGNIVSYSIALKCKEQVADNTFAFTFTKPPDFQYAAGQHARLTVLHTNLDGHESLSRFLSFASAPHEPDLTFSMRISNSLFKQSLLDLKVGQQVLLQMRQRGHHRSFSWSNHPEPNQPAVFIAGGIGVVPALSMIKDAIEHHLATPIYLFYANRCREEAAYLSDLERMSKEHPVFTFIPTMTKPSVSKQTWQGQTGYISRNMIQTYVPDLVCPIYYLAGKSTMVGAMQEMIRDLGVPKSNIRVEDFDWQKMRRMTALSHRRGLTSHLKPTRLVLLIATAAAVHTLIAISLRHEALPLPALSSSGLYLTIGLIVTALSLKIGLTLRSRHKKN